MNYFCQKVDRSVLDLAERYDWTLREGNYEPWLYSVVFWLLPPGERQGVVVHAKWRKLEKKKKKKVVLLKEAVQKLCLR